MSINKSLIKFYDNAESFVKNAYNEYYDEYITEIFIIFPKSLYFFQFSH